MRVVNTCKVKCYAAAVRADIRPQGRSADVDLCGLTTALKKVVKSCGSKFLLRPNGEERMLIARLEDLVRRGDEFRPVQVESPYEASERRRREAEAAEVRAKMASVKAMREEEASVMSETRYASAADLKSARDRAAGMEGVVVARKLEKKEGFSISDLMGDNRFIEEGMKSSGVKTVLASEEGWDVEKMRESGNLAKDNLPDQPVQTAEAPAAPETPEATEAEGKPEKTERKKASRKKGK